MNFTRWSARFPGTQRRAAARDDHSSVPAARAESVRPKATAMPTDDTSEPSAHGPSPEALSAGELLGRLPAPVALLHGPEHRITYVNAAYTSAFGPRPSGVPAAEAMPELAELSLLPLMDQSSAAAPHVRSSPARSWPAIPTR